jgi:hypothetical protein
MNKKILTIGIMLAILIVGFCGCTEKNNLNDDDKTVLDENQIELEEDPYPIPYDSTFDLDGDGVYYYDGSLSLTGNYLQYGVQQNDPFALDNYGIDSREGSSYEKVFWTKVTNNGEYKWDGSNWNLE